MSACEECGEFVADGETICDACDKEGCKRECGCDSLREHNAAILEQEKDFLRDCGPPPAHMSERGVAGALKAMSERRKQLGMDEPPFGSFAWVKKAVGQ